MADADARPLAGRTAVVTGATHGIGSAIARGLAAQGASLVLVVRNRLRAQELAASISDESKVTVNIILADLSAQADVRAAARQIIKRFPAVHILVSNAGILNLRRVLTVDSVEETLAVNHLAPFLLCTKLLPLLKKTAEACPDGRGVRVVFVGSDAQRVAKKFNFDDPNLEKSYSGITAYSQSKLANCMFAFALADRLQLQGVSNVSVTCVHPGAVNTNIANQNGWFVSPIKAALGYFMRSPEQGAAGALWLASAPEAEGLTGKYFTDRVGQAPTDTAPPAGATDAAAWARLWTLSDEMTQPRQEPVLISPPSSPTGAVNTSPLAPSSPLAPASPSAEDKDKARAQAQAKAAADAAAAAHAKAEADAAAAAAAAKAKAEAEAAKARAVADAAAAKKAAEAQAAKEKEKEKAEAEAAAAAKQKAEDEAAEAAAAAAAAAKKAEEEAAAAKKADEAKAAAEAEAAAKLHAEAEVASAGAAEGDEEAAAPEAEPAAAA